MSVFNERMMGARDRPINAAGIDLNLLWVLSALVRRRSVSRAGQEVGLSQPATSNALKRLRDMFNDPLLVRAGGEMVPTERALLIVEQVRPALQSLESAVRAAHGFDPATSDRIFTLAADDLAVLMLLPGLVVARRKAPGVSFRFVPLNLWRSRGDWSAVDVVVALAEMVPADSVQQTLLSGPYVCLGRTNHPLLPTGALDMSRYLSLDHLVVDADNGTRDSVEEALVGRDRRVVLTVPHYLLVPPVIGCSDLVVTLPAYAATMLRRAQPSTSGSLLISTALDIKVEPARLALAWPATRNHESGHRWLRETLFEAVRTLEMAAPI